MDLPKDRHYNLDDGTSTLFFDDGSFGKYYMRGGICWPMMAQIHGVQDVEGYAIMCGFNIDSGVTHVFEQVEFLTIDNILHPETGYIEFKGLASWFNRMWTKYFADHYYWHQPDEVSRKYRLDIFRSEMIEPKPHLVHCEIKDRDQANITIWRNIKLRKILFESESKLHKQLKDVTKRKNQKTIFPSVYALQCAMVGLERFPYRKARAA